MLTRDITGKVKQGTWPRSFRRTIGGSRLRSPGLRLSPQGDAQRYRDFAKPARPWFTRRNPLWLAVAIDTMSRAKEESVRMFERSLLHAMSR